MGTTVLCFFHTECVIAHICDDDAGDSQEERAVIFMTLLSWELDPI